MTEIQNRKTLAYELGVLMFNIVAEHKNSLTFNNDYNGVENFAFIFNSIGSIKVEELEVGFIAECENYNISEQKAKELFAETVKVLDEH